VYWAIVDKLGMTHDLVRQLYWRDFFAIIIMAFPEIYDESYLLHFRGLEWIKNDAWFHAWETGKTGYPLIDAAMRQLNTTGYISNIMRLIVANFLSKLLVIDWRDGEKYFGRKLLDYDVALNNGGWQWAASTGYICLPYTKTYDPRVQSRICDLDCAYIKTWVPQLKDVKPEHIHNWETFHPEYPGVDYPKPIVPFDEQKEIAKKIYEYYEQNKSSAAIAADDNDDEWSAEIETQAFEELF
jgi:deoxyribodipyrimidine photo-lyase